MFNATKVMNFGKRKLIQNIGMAYKIKLARLLCIKGQNRNRIKNAMKGKEEFKRNKKETPSTELGK